MSYDDTLTTDKDKARAALGDTSDDAATELLTDAHINAVLGLYGLNGGVAFMANELTMRFGQQPDRVTLPNGLSVGWGKRTWASLVASGGVIGGGGGFSVGMTRTDGYSEAAALEDA